jgi:allantoinase
MPVADLVIRGSRVVLPEGVASASIQISDGRIVGIGGFDDFPAGSEIIEARGESSVVMPGLVDTHVHVNEPGRTEWEGFKTATLAAAAGGVTTLVDMPLNSIPPTTTVAGLKAKLAAATDKCHVDVGFWAGVVPGNTAELAGLYEAGVVGFKCFLVPSGVDEFPHVTEGDLREAMPELTRLGALLIVHAELPEPIDSANLTNSRPREYGSFLCSRPAAAENEAVAMMIHLSREFGTRVHIVHLSSAEALPLLRDAQAEGLKITAETCPHYLHLVAENIPDGATEYKCCPPIRGNENREHLWRGLTEGTISMIVSDHSPCPGNMKRRDTGDFLDAWGGIASLQLRLPIIWSEAQRRGVSLEEMTKWLCGGPGRLVGFEQRKGEIVEGADADLVIWDPNEEFRVDPQKLHHRHKITPYAGETLRGVVKKTFVRGRKIYDGCESFDYPAGRILLAAKRHKRPEIGRR